MNGHRLAASVKIAKAIRDRAKIDTDERAGVTSSTRQARPERVGNGAVVFAGKTAVLTAGDSASDSTGGIAIRDRARGIILAHQAAAPLIADADLTSREGIYDYSLAVTRKASSEIDAADSARRKGIDDSPIIVADHGTDEGCVGRGPGDRAAEHADIADGAGRLPEETGILRAADRQVRDRVAQALEHAREAGARIDQIARAIGADRHPARRHRPVGGRIKRGGQGEIAGKAGIDALHLAEIIEQRIGRAVDGQRLAGIRRAGELDAAAQREEQIDERHPTGIEAGAEIDL